MLTVTEGGAKAAAHDIGGGNVHRPRRPDSTTGGPSTCWYHRRIPLFHVPRRFDATMQPSIRILPRVAMTVVVLGAYHSHSAEGNTLLLGYSPTSVRLRGLDGAIIASAGFEPADPRMCGANVILLLPATARHVLDHGWEHGYQIKARLGGTWREVKLLDAGCGVTEWWPSTRSQIRPMGVGVRSCQT